MEELIKTYGISFGIRCSDWGQFAGGGVKDIYYWTTCWARSKIWIPILKKELILLIKIIKEKEIPGNFGIIFKKRVNAVDKSYTCSHRTTSPATEFSDPYWFVVFVEICDSSVETVVIAVILLIVSKSG